MGWLNREPAELKLPTDLREALSALRERLLKCPSPVLLQAAQSDVLPVEIAQEINGHVGSCPTCRALVEDLEALDNQPLEQAEQSRIWKKIQTGITAEEPVAGSEGPGKRWWNIWFRPLPLASMAAAVILLIAGLLWIRNRPRPEPEVAVNRAAAQLPTPQTSVLQLEKAPVVLPASAAVTWRGQEDSAKQGTDFRQALAPYESGDYAEAARRLAGVHKRYPKMAEASFYLGVSELFLNQNQKAAQSLKDAANISGSAVAGDANWYLALANHRLGKDDLASSMLEKLCHAGGKGSSRACAGMQELKSRP